MKKIIVSAVTASILILGSCKSGGGDPKTVLLNFFDALEKKDFPAIKKYTTKESESMIGIMQMGMENMGDKSNDMINYQKENMELGSAIMDGDKATVPVKDKKTGEVTDFILKKESGDWKVAFDQSSLMEMAQKKIKRGFGDSLNINSRSMQNIDSITRESMQDAKKMMDSASKILKDAEK